MCHHATHVQVHPVDKIIELGFLDQKVNAHMVLTDIAKLPCPGVVSVHTLTNNAGAFLFPHILTKTVCFKQ